MCIMVHPNGYRESHEIRSYLDNPAVLWCSTILSLDHDQDIIFSILLARAYKFLDLHEINKINFPGEKQ